jgi:hypothetical protein
MALSSRQRSRLPASAFVYPRQRLYPIDTPARARNALARAAQSRTRGRYQTVARAVRRRYGNRVGTVGPARGTVSRPGYRRGPGGRAAGTRPRAARARSMPRARSGRFVARSRGRRR